jgi:hypothetical protein
MSLLDTAFMASVNGRKSFTLSLYHSVFCSIHANDRLQALYSLVATRLPLDKIDVTVKSQRLDICEQ